MAQKTAKFIEDRLRLIEEELSAAEIEVERYKTENGVVTIDYSLLKFKNDYTGEFKYEGKTYQFNWSVIDNYNVKVEFNDESSGIVTFKDDDIIVFNYNNMMFVYEDIV